MEHEVKRTIYWAIPAVAAALLMLWLGNSLLTTSEESAPARQPSAAVAVTGGGTAPSTTTAVGTTEVTFVELGSLGCIPCEQMKPVMKAVEEGYGGRVKVIFHDVRVEPKWAAQFGIQLIPTQVFLDAAGNEFFRHQGFFPKEDIDALLASRGIKPTGGV